jgi:hypothetical protein
VAYLCVECIEAHGLVHSSPVGLGFGRTATSVGPCESCQPVAFGWEPAPSEFGSKYTVWVPWVLRSLDDPEAIPRQLAEADCARGVVALLAWLLGAT